MSAQSTINKGMTGGLHIGPVLANLAIATALAVGLVMALLWSSSLAPKSQAGPAFDAPAFRAGERNLVISPAFDAPAFRAAERTPVSGPAFDAPAFRAAEKALLAGSAASTGSSFVGDRGIAPRTSGGSSFVGDRGIAPRTSGD